MVKRGGGAFSNVSETSYPKRSWVPNLRNFCDFLHAGTRYEKQ